MPEKLAWNSVHLVKVIEGARQVLLPPEASAGFFSASWFLLTNWGVLSMPDGQKLEDSLSPELRARFVAARGSIKRSKEHYDDKSPLVAGFLLESEYDEFNKLSGDEPGRTVEKIARAKHVKLRKIAHYDAMPPVKEILKLGPEQGWVCLANAVSDVETRAAHAVPAAEAWAAGDIKPLKAHYSTSNLTTCAFQTKSFNTLFQRSVDDSLKAIHEALATPGKTVMLVDVGELLRNAGVAEKLRAEGIVIEGPAE